MKPAIDVKEGSPPTGQWTRARGARGHVNRVELVSLSRRNKERRSEAKPRAVIRVTHRYGAPPTRTFDAWLDPEVAGRWLFATASQPIAHVEIDGQVGGSFRFVDQEAADRYTGQYIEIVPDRRLVFTLSMEPHPNVVTRVTVAIAPFASGCTIKLAHENVPRGQAEYVEGRWTGILYGLGVTLDSLSAALQHDQE